MRYLYLPGRRNNLGLLSIMLALMFKARCVGVPKTLTNFPLLWWPILGRRRRGEETLLQVNKALNQFFTPMLRVSFIRRRMCLAKCLVLAWYAKRLGMEAILHFGVKVKSNRLKGHCWMSYPWSEKLNEQGSKGGDFVEIWKFQVHG